MTETLHIQLNKIAASRLDSVDFNTLSFGHVFSDHMFVADYTEGEWKQFHIMPYGDLPFSPAMSALHYGQAIFEGMKAYRQKNGQVAVFRPEKNLERLNISAERMCMPTVPKDVFMQGLAQLINIDRQWVPSGEGQSMYIRPMMFATDAFLGVHASSSYKFIILTGPVGAYYSKSLKVKVELHYSRADEGGVGYAKTAGNYARALYPTKLAEQEGFDQLIWTDSKEHAYIEEAGTANVLFVIDNVLVTPSTRDTILDGISRHTILDLARSWEMQVEERRVSVDEIIGAVKKGNLQEAFAAGTAATIAPISEIGYKGELYTLPDSKMRVFSNKALQVLNNIRYGLIPDPFGWNYLV